jgi:selenocysteine-specific elongation factor
MSALTAAGLRKVQYHQMFVIGTAGHVDHGKSTLVKALTGIDPDRWEEEQRRQMTIDLGFAWLTLPDGRQVSLVDVPGHERFIKNMLAGVGGIHAVLLVIAADESLMPQTYEHLAILDLLGVRHGIVAVTKADLVDDEWLALVQEEISRQLAATSLAAIPQIAVSARSGAGLEQLRSAIADLAAAATPADRQAGVPRLSIDRSFTVGGFGTVVTGTLLGGPLAVGDEVELLPAGLRARIRGLQNHQHAVDRVLPGSRTAVNLSGVHHSRLQRGDLLTTPGAVAATSLVDVRLRVTSDAPPLKQNDALDLFIGAAEARCRLTLLDCEELAAGQSGWAQLRLMTPLAPVKGERLILRVPSPSQTVAGGQVIDPQPARHRRFRPEVIAALELRERGEPADLLLSALPAAGLLPLRELAAAAALPLPTAAAAAARLAAAQQITLLPPAAPDQLVIRTADLHRLQQTAHDAVAGYHRRWPLRRGMPREELRRRLKLEGRSFPAVLTALATLIADETTVRLADWLPQPDNAGRLFVERYLQQAAQTPFAAPTPETDGELLNWMLEQRLIVKLADDAYLLPSDYHSCVDWVRAHLQAGNSVTVAEVRTRFATSRRYALALLEHLDTLRITRRVGDSRVAGDAV